MHLDELKTLTGLTLKELSAKLDAQLEPDAYKKVEGAGDDLTDILPGFMKRELNACFGVCGLGWGYDYSAADVTVEPSNTRNNGFNTYIKRLMFWALLVDPSGTHLKLEIPASGGSDNKNAAYALKGAITSALGNAVSNLGFQEQVYLGKRDHNTVRGKPTTQSAPSAKAETRPCPIHHVPMREYPKKDGKGKYFAHKDADKWCYGTAEKKAVAA